MRTNGHRSAGTSSTGKRTPLAASRAMPASGIAPEALVALYSQNYDAALEYVHAAFSAAARWQALELAYGEQALSLAGKAMNALSASESGDVLTAQAGLTEEALREAARCWEQMVAVSEDAQRDFLRVFDRQCRINGLPNGLPMAALSKTSSATQRAGH